MKRKVLLFLLFLLFILYPKIIFACGLCMNYLMDLYFPFFRYWSYTIGTWFLICIIFWVLSSYKKIEIPFKLKKQEFIIIVILVVVSPLFILVMGIWLSIAIISPFCIYWMYRFFRYKYRMKLIPIQHMFKYFNFFSLIVIFCLLLYSYVDFMNTDRLMGKLDHWLSCHVVNLLTKKNEIEVVPRINPIVEAYDISNYRSKRKLLHCILILKHFKSKSSASAIESVLLRKTDYHGYDGDINRILLESAKAYAMIEREKSREVILKKFSGIVNKYDANKYTVREVLEELLEAAFLTGDTNTKHDYLEGDQDSVGRVNTGKDF